MKQQENVTADSKLIRWLLDESGVTKYQIEKDVGISQSTLSRLARGEIKLDSIRYGSARQLTDYARRVKTDQERQQERGTES